MGGTDRSFTSYPIKNYQIIKKITRKQQKTWPLTSTLNNYKVNLQRGNLVKKGLATKGHNNDIFSKKKKILPKVTIMNVHKL